MAGQDATVAAVRTVLTRLCKRTGLSRERLRNTEIDVGPLLELYVVRRHAHLTRSSPSEAVLPVVRDLVRRLPAPHRLIADVALSLGLLRDDLPDTVDPDRLYAADLGGRREYLSRSWTRLPDTGATAGAPPPTARQLRGRLEYETFTLLAQRLAAASGYASLASPPPADTAGDARTGTLTVIGEAVLDNICTIDGALPTPGRPGVGVFVDRPGGKGLDRAVAAARLGLRVRLVSVVGGDYRGHRILDHLRAEGVETDLIRVVPGTDTPVAVVLVTSTGETPTIACPSDRVRLVPEDLRTPAAYDALANSDAVLVTFEPPATVIETALDIVSSGASALLVQPVPATGAPHRFYRYFGGIDYLIGTRDELAALTPMAEPPTPSHDSDAELLRRLRILGATTVCLVEGFATTVRSDDLEITIGPFPVALKDSPGASAAFAAALARRVATGGRADPDDFLWATAAMAATQSTGEVSGVMPTTADIDRMLELAGPAVTVRTEAP